MKPPPAIVAASARATPAVISVLLAGLILLSSPSAATAQFTYTNINGGITILKYTGSNAAVAIPASIGGVPVNNIGSSAFLYSSIASVTFPGSLTNIGFDAFAGCGNLTNITIPGSVSVIRIGAFNGCYSLTNLTIPSGVVSIQDQAFFDTSMSQVLIPDSVTNIGREAFSYCLYLKSFAVDPLNSSFTSSDNVVYSKDLTTLVECAAGRTGAFAVPGSVTNIGKSAFTGCEFLTGITVPDSVVDIGINAFQACLTLTNITLPAGLLNLQGGVFNLCQTLRGVNLPAGITNIGSSAFYSCDKLAGVVIPGGVATIGISAFHGCVGLSRVTMTGSVTAISRDAFSYCASLTNLTLPGSITNLGMYGFQYCSNLAGIFFQGDPPNLESNVFDSDNKLTVYYLPGTSGWNTNFGGRPAVLWNPQVQTGDPSLGVRSNRFGFNVMGTANIPIVFEACTNLGNPVWVSLQNSTLTNGSLYFSDSKWTNYPARIYRVRSP